MDLSDWLDSWLRELRGQRKSPRTVAGYRSAVRSFLDYCATQADPPILETSPLAAPAESTGLSALSRENVIGYLAAYPGQTSTARLHLTVIKLFARWLANELDGFDPAPVLAVRPPASDQKAIPNLTESEVDRMLKACEGRGLAACRDKAMLTLFVETGLRAAEMIALDVGHVDLDGCTVFVARGKGGRGRHVQFSPAAAAAVDRWLRARRRVIDHPASGPLWISASGRRLTYRGVASALKARAVYAGVAGFHLHRLRHTTAVRWLAGGGSETGLMAHAGWRSRTMIERYTRTASEELAGQEFNRLHLGLDR